MTGKKKAGSRFKGHTLRMVVFWVLILALFIGELLVHTWSRLQCVRIGYEISREMETHQKLLEIQNRLKIELARLKTPERISSIARSRLELVIPTPDQKKTLTVFEAD
jgi:cell division protein FtsL